MGTMHAGYWVRESQVTDEQHNGIIASAFGAVVAAIFLVRDWLRGRDKKESKALDIVLKSTQGLFDRVSMLEAQQVRDREYLQTARQELDMVKDEAAECQQRYTSLEVKYQGLQKAYGELEARNSELEDKVAEQESRISEQNAKITELQALHSPN